MTRLIKTLVVIAVLAASTSNVLAQSGEMPLNIYGYFQTSGRYTSEENGTFFKQPAQTSFSMQQLNFFFQKGIAPRWSSFVNFELTNTFSTERSWGTMNVEEAWVRYKKSDAFTVKAGLLIPEFNNMNKIKNRTPLLPYIMRPIAYEASLGGRLNLEAYTPQRAWVEVSGVLTSGSAKVDYSGYIGNSPSITKNLDGINAEQASSAQDTTDTFLLGSRVGVRIKGLKIGFSGTYDKTNEFEGLGKSEVARTRFGSDVSFKVGKADFEAEYIAVSYDIELNYGFPGGDLDRSRLFWYGTAGYNLTEEIYAYAMYSYLEDTDKPFSVYKLTMPMVGLNYSPNYRTKVKFQYTLVDLDINVPIMGIKANDGWNIYSVGLSVFF